MRKQTNPPQRIILIICGFIIAYLLLWDQFYSVPTRSQLTMVQGIIAEAEWRGIKNPQFLFRMSGSDLWFTVWQGLMPRDSGAMSDTLRPGVDVTVGYEATSHIFQNTAIRKVALLVIGDREYFGPETMGAFIRRERPMAFIVAAFGIATALYNIIALFRSRTHEERV
jgi:hypothetical protein